MTPEEKILLKRISEIFKKEYFTDTVEFPTIKSYSTALEWLQSKGIKKILPEKIPLLNKPRTP